MTARMHPLEPPFAPALKAQLDAVMRGRPPLRLFTTLARDERLWGKFAAGSLLDCGHLTVRQRELVIGRTTARCRAEYEWGVHIAAFGAKAGLTEPQVRALVHGDADDVVWSADDRLLIALSDALHDDCDIGDVLWQALRACFNDEALLELLMLAGFYRTVSYLVNALRLPLEPQTPRFPA
jgi:alkylhydroperoxidase family enzyme